MHKARATCPVCASGSDQAHLDRDHCSRVNRARGCPPDMCHMHSSFLLSIIHQLCPPQDDTHSSTLGLIPPASALSTIPIFSLSGQPPPASGLATSTTSEASQGHGSIHSGQAMLVSTALSTIAAKVMTKINSSQYIPMKDLLADNISLCNQLEALPGAQHVYTSLPKPRLREILSPTNLGVPANAVGSVISKITMSQNVLCLLSTHSHYTSLALTGCWVALAALHDRVEGQHARKQLKDLCVMEPALVLLPCLHLSVEHASKKRDHRAKDCEETPADSQVQGGVCPSAQRVTEN